MNQLEKSQNKSAARTTDGSDQDGSAIVIALLVLALLGVFVALALTRTSSEAASVGNETAETQTFYAAQGSLETMTRNFVKTFETSIAPTSAQLDAVRSTKPAGLANYTFSQTVTQTSNSVTKTLTQGDYVGLYASQDNWRLQTTVTNPNGAQVQLTRDILNNRVPIFQFGIFYDGDLELFNPPQFGFGGRVHTNGNFFLLSNGSRIDFNSRVTMSGQLITKVLRNGVVPTTSDAMYITNAAGTPVQLLASNGSVVNTTAGNANNIFAGNTDLPPSAINPSFTGFPPNTDPFQGNLQVNVPKLKLPLKLDPGSDLVDLIKRGKEVGDLENKSGTTQAVTAATADSSIVRSQRYADKAGIRVALADSKVKLPGCAAATVTTVCGIRLDGDATGDGTDVLSSSVVANKCDVIITILGGYRPDKCVRGYQPIAMTDGYKATRMNGERIYNGNQPSAQEVWIKIETVTPDVNGNAPVTKDITADILSLGVTEPIQDTSLTVNNYLPTNMITLNGSSGAPSSNLLQTTPQTPSTTPDSRSIIKLQRFAIPGAILPIDGSANVTGATKYTFPSSSNNYAARYYTAATPVNAPLMDNGCVFSTDCIKLNDDPNIPVTPESRAHMKRATMTVNSTSSYVGIVPFPIEMFDTREGVFYDNANFSSTAWTTPTGFNPSLFSGNNPYYINGSSGYVRRVALSGLMSMIDIDVANLRRFLRGDYDGAFPTATTFATSNGGTGLKAANIPSSAGYVLYVSDRRGDYNFDGSYTMEDIYGFNNGTIDPGEDLNNNGVLEADYTNETPRYKDAMAADQAAVNDHKYNRRAVRLINGTVLPGLYDATTPNNTKGFTVASENGVYVKGNYNATGATAPGSTGNTPYDQYSPNNTATHIPASIAADAVTILSNNWNDSNSFINPYTVANRFASETTIRFAMLAGATVANKDVAPNQGGSNNFGYHMNGGVHNFKRFLEQWSDASGQVRLNYDGSLINLFTSRNNNAAYKCCVTVYVPPRRNWVFDSTFQDPNRLPPGTPYFQFAQTTGFTRSNF